LAQFFFCFSIGLKLIFESPSKGQSHICNLLKRINVLNSFSLIIIKLKSKKLEISKIESCFVIVIFFGKLINLRIVDVTSAPFHVTCGVPQGMMLGPLLYLVCVDMMRCYLADSCLTLFANDTASTFLVSVYIVFEG